MRRIHSKTLVASIALVVLAWAVVSSAQAPRAPALQDPDRSLEGNEPSQVPNIMSLTEWTRIPGPDGVLGEGYRSSYLEYDRDGYPLEQSTYDADGSIIQRILNSYDGTGRILESVSEERLGLGNARTVFEYDGEDLIGTTGYRPDGSVLVAARCEYNELGQMTSMVTEVPDASTSQRIVFEYDADGNAVATTTYDSERGMVSRAETTYGDDQWPLETTGLLPGGVVASVTDYRYGPDGNVTEMHVRNADGDVIQRILNTYDDEGRIVEAVTSNASGMEYRVEMAYDEDGNRAIDRTFNKLGQLVREVRYEYEFHAPDED